MKRKGGKDTVEQPTELQNKQERGKKRQGRPLAIDRLIDPWKNEKERGQEAVERPTELQKKRRETRRGKDGHLRSII